MDGATIHNISDDAVRGFDLESITNDDAAWALTCGFLILTMQTGFAMLECGCVSAKNVANIMIKNVVDVSLGGLTYWMFGYGISFGKPANRFCGMGSFFFAHTHQGRMGSEYAHYFFQLSFATTATTIVSGAVAERMKLHAYMMFSLVNTVVYCFPASWAWGDEGFLNRLGFFDFAGVCVVHMCGGVSALVSIIMLGPRINRFDTPEKYEMSSPVTALTGMFMLMWAWLGFNCGSTFGVTDRLWKISALVSVTTINGAIGGGIVGLSFSMWWRDGKIIVSYIINSVLGGLVGVTGIASVTSTWEALIIGGIAGQIAILAEFLLVKLKLDDPVGAIPVHLCASSWGTIAIGLFGTNNGINQLRGYNGLFHGGGFKLLGCQLTGMACIVAWSGGLTFLFLLLIKKTMGIRVSIEEEILGADWVEHDLRSEKLSAKLEAALRAIDEQYLDTVVTNVIKDIADDKHMSKEGQRIFSATTLGKKKDAEPLIADDTNKPKKVRKRLFSITSSDKFEPNEAQDVWKSKESGTGLYKEYNNRNSARNPKVDGDTSPTDTRSRISESELTDISHSNSSSRPGSSNRVYPKAGLNNSTNQILEEEDTIFAN